MGVNSLDSFQRESISYKHLLVPSLPSAVPTLLAERDLSGSMPPVQEQITGMAGMVGLPAMEGSTNAVRTPADLGSWTRFSPESFLTLVYGSIFNS